MDFVSMDFIRLIRDELKTKHMTQKDLALRANVTEPCISRILHHNRLPRLDTLLLILDALGMELDVRRKRP